MIEICSKGAVLSRTEALREIPAGADRGGVVELRGPAQAPATAAAITRLVLTDFRCYRRLEVDSGAPTIVLTGANGAGKTNLLEAISYLAPGRGLRHAKLSNLTRHAVADGAPVLSAQTGWSVAATLATPLGERTVGTGLVPAPGSPNSDSKPLERRRVRIDGIPASGPAALSGVVHISWLTPQMDRLFEDGAGGRRRFLDRLVFGFDPGHGSRVNAYEKAMRERNRLLRDGAADPAWLDGLEDVMAGHGVAIAAARRDTAERLNEVLGAGAGPFPGAGIAISGTPEDWLDEAPAVDAEDRLREALAGLRQKDAAAGRATIGPHRSDLEVRHAAKGLPASQCSTGEQKALLISLMLANARVHQRQGAGAPILLLDEVTAHLDGERREALFAELRAFGSQAWLTGTERALFAGLDGDVLHYQVGGGALRPA